MNSHKHEEKFYLSRFKDVCPLFPDGIITDSESPDFLVHGSDGIVGIELTRVYRPDPIEKTLYLPEIEKYRDEIVDKIKNYYLDNGGSPLRVSIHFSGNFTDKNCIKDKDLEAIADLIKKYKPQIDDLVYFPDCLKSVEYFPSWLDRVSIRTRDWNGENFWTASKTGWIPKLSPTEIQNEIGKKQEKYFCYLEKCSCAWLVLMTNVGESLGTRVNFSTDVWNHRYETLFDQVWIFQNPDSARKLKVVKHNSKQDRL